MEMNRVNLMANANKRSQMMGGISANSSDMSKQSAGYNLVGHIGNPLKDNSINLMRKGLSDATSNDMGENSSLPSYNTLISQQSPRTGSNISGYLASSPNRRT